MSLHSKEIENRILAAYQAVPDHIKEDLHQAIWWAVATLTNHEGAGHIFQVSPYSGVVCDDWKGLECEFSKPEWPGSHVGRPMETGSEAVVMAVCEYLNGA